MKGSSSSSVHVVPGPCLLEPASMHCTVSVVMGPEMVIVATGGREEVKGILKSARLVMLG